MALNDMREYLAVLEQQGLVRRVTEEVDASWEIGCMVKWGFQAFDEKDRFGFLFIYQLETLPEVSYASGSFS